MLSDETKKLLSEALAKAVDEDPELADAAKSLQDALPTAEAPEAKADEPKEEKEPERDSDDDPHSFAAAQRKFTELRKANAEPTEEAA